MKSIPGLLLSLLALSAYAQEPPPSLVMGDYIDSQEELQRLGSIDGIWEGHLTIVEDPVGANRQYPDGYPFRIEIRDEEVGLWFIEEGDRLDPLPGDAWLVFTSDETGLVNYVAGNDAFTETWSISLSKTEPDEMEVHVLRTVHNFAVRKDSPWRVFAVYSTSTVERVE